jgi:hypothetical protein
MNGDFADKGDFHAILGIFYMPQICDTDRQLFFLSEGRLPDGFIALENRKNSAGCEPTNSGTKRQRGNPLNTLRLYIDYV